MVIMGTNCQLGLEHIADGRAKSRLPSWLNFLLQNLRTPRPATEPRNCPTRNFHEKYRKNTPRPEILDSQNLPPKCPENTEKIPPKYQKCTFLVFSRYFWGIFLGFQNFGPRGIFLVFFVEIPGRAISGLCSRSGRSQYKTILRNNCFCNHLCNSHWRRHYSKINSPNNFIV